MDNSWNAINQFWSQSWLTWSKDCVITTFTVEEKFQITETNLYVPVVILLTQDN